MRIFINKELASEEKSKRLAGLQDGVYAIVMTLLVLELKVPHLGEHVTSAEFIHAMVDLWPKVVIWMLSFSVLGAFWLSDVRALSSTPSIDRKLITIGLWKLALVSLIPFTTNLVGEFPENQVANIIYAAHIAVLAAIQAFRTRYILKNRSISTWSDEDAELNAIKSVAVVFCSTASLGLSFVVPGYNVLALMPSVLADAAHRRILSKRRASALASKAKA